MKTGKIKCTPITFGGSTKKGEPYCKFKDVIKKGFKGHIKGSVNLEIELFIKRDRIRKHRNDLDNFLKPIIDAINENRVIENESMIESIFIKRIIVKKDEGVIIGINSVKKYLKLNTYFTKPLR